MASSAPAKALQGTLGRAVAEVMIGGPEAADQRAQNDAEAAGGDFIQMVHVNVNALATRKVQFTDVSVVFPQPFFMGIDPTLSDSNIETPHFATGIEMDSPAHISLDAHLRAWTRDQSGWITGATLKVAAWAPDAPKPVSFTAILHLTFSGYAAPSDDEQDM